VAVTSTATEINLLDGVTSTTAEINILDGVTTTSTELNKLDALSRGSILYGNASSDTTVLTKGTANQVLTSDGTDISWSAVDAGIAWQSSVVTASTITVVASRGYWINTTSNACTITLPASASVGDELIFTDYLRTWGTNALTINQNSLKFQGNTSPNPVYNTNGQSVRLVYSGATQGWIPTVDDDVTNETPQPITTDFLVIAGGGSGSDWTASGGGGAGGYRNSYSSETSGGGGSSETALGLTAGVEYTITVGAGGTAPGAPSIGNAGANSSISGTGITTITSIGGGAGINQNSNTGTTGGSGGGGADDGPYEGPGASGTANQGYAGGDATSPFTGSGGGGGGGASAVGSNGSSSGGNGGNGLASSITGSSVTRGGGGGAGTYNGTAGTGGTGGGGNGAKSAGEGPDNATAGGANTGGGGGSTDQTARNGGSGVVILRLATAEYTGTTSGSPTVSTSGSDTILTFNASGSYTA